MKNRRTLYKFVWWVYIALLFIVVIVKFNGSFAELEQKIAATQPGSNCNLVPLYSIGVQIRHISEGWARLNLLGNFVPFVPFGLLLPLAYPKTGTFVRVAGIGLLFLIFVEVFQFFTRLGSFDVDDIILNMVGVICGYLMWMCVDFLAKRREKRIS